MQKKVSIKITVPKKGDNWQLTYNGGRLYRISPTVIYNSVERRLLKLRKQTKIDIHVGYSRGVQFYNKGTYEDPRAALYALACFLEDYLMEALQKEKYRKYEGAI